MVNKFTQDSIEFNRYKILKEITKLRNEEQISQKMMSEVSGLSQPTISRIEHGSIDPSLRTILRYLKAINKTITIVDI